MFSNIVNALQASLLESWSGFGNIVINIIIACVISVVFCVISLLIAKFVKKLFDSLRIDLIFEKIGIHHWFAVRDLTFSVSSIVCWIVKWTGLIGALILFLRLLNLQTALIYLKALGGFVVKGVSSGIILLVGFFVANFVKNLLLGLSKAFRVDVVFGHWVSGFVKWGIVVFTFIFSLSEFQISESILKSFLTAFLAMIALAGGIMFGLSGKAWADRIIEKLRKDVE